MTRGQRGRRGQPSKGTAVPYLDGLHGGRTPDGVLPDRILGGCPDCAAYQTLDARLAPLYQLTVHHDDTCPAYRRVRDKR